MFKVTPDGVTQNYQSNARWPWKRAGWSHDIEVDLVGNVYVAGGGSDNVFKIAPDGVTIEIIDATGDGLGNHLEWFKTYCG